LPHSRSVDDPTQLQEERRLLYVGMTRARKRLYMFRAFQRRFRGQSGSQMASRFLLEIPDTLVTTRDIRGHDRVADRMPDPMWTKRMASTPGPRPASKSNEGYTAGEKVRHKAFGEGVVVSSSGVGSDTQVTVAFSGQGIKRLMLSFAPLEKVVEEESKQQFDPDEDNFETQDPELFAP
jgi:DNA helicase-2/ATP-dependent DNA helicase PcrA